MAYHRPKRSYQIAEWRGRLAEIYILVFFLFQGYWPLYRRYQTTLGEIDLILRRGHHLAFIEVKYRRRWQVGSFPLSARSQRRFYQATDLFLAHHPRYHSCQIQMMLAIVSGWGRIKIWRDCGPLSISD